MGKILDRFTGNISPIALLVSSFFWSWLDIVTFSPALFLTAGKPIDVTPFVVSFATSALLLALFASSGAVRSRVLKARVFAGCSLICGSIGTLLIWIGIHTSPVLVVVGGVLIGLYQSVGSVVAGSIATCQGTTNALIHLAAALPLNIVAIILVVLLRPAASVGFAILLPLFSALCFAVFLARGQNRPTLESVTSIRAKRPKEARRVRRIFGCDPYFLLMVLAICVSFGFVNFQTMFAENVQGVSLDYAEILVRAATSLTILIGYLLYSWRPYSILRFALVLMSVGLIAGGTMSVAGVGDTFVANALTLTGYACFDLLIWTIIVMLSYRSGASLLRIICVVYTVDQFGIFAGTSLGLAAHGDGATIVSSIVLGSVLLLVTLGFSSGKNAVKDSLSTYEIEFGKAEAAVQEGGAPDAATSPGYQSRIDNLAAQYFLTTREMDVLALLVAGRNGPYIAEHLHVSDNTVKSHIRHIYTKLDVHNRQELLDLVFPLSSDRMG